MDAPHLKVVEKKDLTKTDRKTDRQTDVTDLTDMTDGHTDGRDRWM